MAICLTRDERAAGGVVTLRIDILSDPGQVAALVPEWDALALRDPRTTPYDCGTLMTGLGAIAEDIGAPYVVVARTAAGSLAGVLPLRRVRAPGRLGGHKLIAYPAWHASYFDAAVDPAYPGVAHALLDALSGERDWERCHLQYLRPVGNLFAAVRDGEPEAFGSSQLIEQEGFSLSSDGGVMAHKSARRLSKAGVIEFTPAVAGPDLEIALRRFAELHTQRWEGHGDSAEFANPATVIRLIDTIKRMARLGVARVGALTLSGTIVAVHLAFRWRETQYSWRMAHDAEWQAMSPGRLLMSLMIEEALSTGSRCYDLGRGNEGYKHLWPTIDRPLYRLTRWGTSWRARLAAFRART